MILKGEAELRSLSTEDLLKEKTAVTARLTQGQVENRPAQAVESLLNDAQSVQMGTATPHLLMDYRCLIDEILAEREPAPPNSDAAPA